MAVGRDDGSWMTERVSLDWARSNWGELDGLALLRAALTGPFAGQIAMVSSFGAESAVLLDMVASVDRRTPVVFLETGKLFPETLAYKDELVDWLRLEDVRSIQPGCRPSSRIPIRTGICGSREPDLCCHIRKTEPLDQALAGFAGWITGRKRFQGGVRTALPAIESRPGHRPAQAQPVGRTGPRTTSGTIAGCASCRCILCWRAAIPSIGCSPAHGRSRMARMSGPVDGGSSTRPSAASIAAKVSSRAEQKAAPRDARCGLATRLAVGGEPEAGQPFTASLRPLPDLNLTTLLAAILIDLAGLRVAAFALRPLGRPRTPQSRRSKPSDPCSGRPGYHAARRSPTWLASLFGLPVAVATAELSSSRVINALPSYAQRKTTPYHECRQLQIAWNTNSRPVAARDLLASALTTHSSPSAIFPLWPNKTADSAARGRHIG